jgi:hypothetical protein
VDVKKKDSLGAAPARSFEDYEVTVGEAPAGVELIDML